MEPASNITATRADVERVRREIGASARFPPSVLNDRVLPARDLDDRTRVVDVSLEPEVSRQLQREVRQLASLQAEIESYDQNRISRFNDFSLYFYYAALFSRALVRLIDDNRDTIESVLPGNDWLLGEIFFHEGRSTPLLHTGTTTVVNALPVAKYIDNLNLHITLTDNTSVRGNPFLIWEQCDSEITTSRYMYNFLVASGVITAENRATYLGAVAQSESASRTDHRNATSFLYRQYWRALYADRMAQIDGVYALYDQGKGVVFSPTKPHGGDLLTRSITGFAPRISVSIRILRVNRRRMLRDLGAQLTRIRGWGALMSVLRKNHGTLEQHRINLELYARMLGYRSRRELVRALYGGHKPVAMIGLPISLSGARGYVSLDRLREHGERCDAFHSSYALTDRARAFLEDYYRDRSREQYK